MMGLSRPMLVSTLACLTFLQECQIHQETHVNRFGSKAPVRKVQRIGHHTAALSSAASQPWQVDRGKPRPGIGALDGNWG